MYEYVNNVILERFDKLLDDIGNTYVSSKMICIGPH